MKITLVCLLLSAMSAFAATPALEGIVKDVNGHPVKGADVKIEARTGTFSKTVKTDARGHYFSNGMKLGIYYKVTLVVNGTVKASILNATAQSGKPATLNFDLKTAKVAPKTHLVYVPAQTGTHIGGDRWVEVDDQGKVVNDNPNVETLRGKAVRQLLQSGGTNTRGGN
jgi:Carboxypeptidase regulatory-like domain